MSKGKNQGTPKGDEVKTAQPNPNPLPQLQRRPAMSVPRVAPRTRASPKGR